MALYRYKAVTAARRSRRRTIRRRLERRSRRENPGRGQHSARCSRSGRRRRRRFARGCSRRSAMGPNQVLQFTQQLRRCSARDSRSIARLQILLELPESEKAKRIVERIRDTVRGGAPLSEASRSGTGRVLAPVREHGARRRNRRFARHDVVASGRLPRALESAEGKRRQRDDLSGDPRRDGARRVVRAAGVRRAAVRADVQGHERRAADDHESRAVRRQCRAVILVADAHRRGRADRCDAACVEESADANEFRRVAADRKRRTARCRRSSKRRVWRVRWELCSRMAFHCLSRWASRATCSATWRWPRRSTRRPRKSKRAAVYPLRSVRANGFRSLRCR